MAIFFGSRYSLSSVCCCLAFCLIAMSATRPVFSFSFSFSKFDKDDPVFASQISLLGDAEVVDGESSVRITRPMASSSGRILYNRLLDLSGKNPKKIVAFTAHFSFSISPGHSDGLAFLLVPKCLRRKSLSGSPSLGVFPGVVAVEFDTWLDPEYRDPNANHVGIDIGSLVSVSARDASMAELVLNGGERLYASVSYDLNSKELQVRVSKFEAFRHYEPLISYHFDLPEIFRDGFYVGLSSSSRNATGATSVYSWSFKLRRIPSSMHSEPLDPLAKSEISKPAIVHSQSDHLLRVLGGMIFGAGCGVVVAVLVLVIWSAFLDRRRRVAPQVYPAYPVEVVYEEIVVKNSDKNGVDGKKFENDGGLDCVSGGKV